MGVGSSMNNRMFVVDRKVRPTLERLDTSFNRTASQLKTILNEEIQLVKKIDPKNTKALSEALDTLIILRERSVVYRVRIRKMIPLTDAHRLVLKDLRRYLRRIRYHTSKIGRLLGKTNKKFNAYIGKLPQDIVPIRKRRNYRNIFTKPITKDGLVQRVNKLPNNKGNAPYVEVVTNVEPRNKEALLEMSHVVEELEERNNNVRSQEIKLNQNESDKNNTAVKMARVKSKEVTQREEIRSQERIEKSKIGLERQKLQTEQKKDEGQASIESQKIRAADRERQNARDKEATNRRLQAEKERREMSLANRERQYTMTEKAANRRLEIQKQREELRATKERESGEKRLQGQKLSLEEAKQSRLNKQRILSESREGRLMEKERRQRGSPMSRSMSQREQRGSLPMSQREQREELRATKERESGEKRGSPMSRSMSQRERGSFPMSQMGQTPSQPSGFESIEALKLKQKSADSQSKREIELDKLKSKRDFEIESKRLKATQNMKLAELKSNKITKLAELKSNKNSKIAEQKTSKQVSKNDITVKLAQIRKNERIGMKETTETTSERKGRQSLDKRQFEEGVRKAKVNESKNRRGEMRVNKDKKNEKANKKQAAKETKREAKNTKREVEKAKEKEETKELKDNISKLLGAFTQFRKGGKSNNKNDLKIQLNAIAALVDDRQVKDYIFSKRITEPSIMKTSEKVYTTVAKMYMQSSAFEDEQVEKLIPLLDTMSLEELETLRYHFNVKLFALSNEPTYVKNVKELYISNSRVQKYMSEVLPTNSEIYRWYQKYSTNNQNNTLWGPPNSYVKVRGNYKVMFDRMLSGVKEYEAKYDNISTGLIKTTPYIKKIFETNTNKEINREYDKIERYILRQEISKIKDRLACGPLTVQFVKYFNVKNNPNGTIPDNKNKNIKVESFKKMKDFINNASIDTLHDIRQERGTQVSKRENTYMNKLSKNEHCVVRTFLKQPIPVASQAYAMYLNPNNRNNDKYYTIRMNDSFRILDTWFERVDLKTIISIPADIKFWLYNGKSIKNQDLGSFAVSVLKTIVTKHVKTIIGKEETLEWVIATLQATNDNFNLDYTNLPKNTNKSSTNELKKELSELEQMYNKSKSTAEIDIIKHELWWREMTNFSNWSQMIKNFRTSIKKFYNTKEDMPEKLAEVFRRFRNEYQQFEKAPFMLYRQKIGYALGLLKNDMNILNNPPPLYGQNKQQYNRKPQKKLNTPPSVKLSLPKALSIPGVNAPKLTLPKTAIQFTLLRTVVQLKTPTRKLKSIPIPHGAITLSVDKKKLSIPKHIGTSIRLTPGEKHVMRFYAPKPPILRNTRPALKNLNGLVNNAEKKKANFEIEKERKAEEAVNAEEAAAKEKAAAAKKAAEEKRKAEEEANKAIENAINKLTTNFTMVNLKALNVDIDELGNNKLKQTYINQVTNKLNSKFQKIVNQKSEHATHLKTLGAFDEELLNKYGVKTWFNQAVSSHKKGLTIDFRDNEASRQQIINTLKNTTFQNEFKQLKKKYDEEAAVEDKRIANTAVANKAAANKAEAEEKRKAVAEEEKKIINAQTNDDLKNIEKQINENIEMNIEKIMVTKFVPKKYNRRNGFLDFRSKAKTPEEKTFLEVYYKAHEALKSKSKNECTKSCRRVLEHIDSIFDMTKLQNKNIKEVRAITEREITCLKKTIEEIPNLGNYSDYNPSCDGLMDQIHRENFLKDKETLLTAIQLVSSNTTGFDLTTLGIKQATKDEFIGKLSTQTGSSSIPKNKRLSQDHIRVLFDFIDTRIEKNKQTKKQIVSRNYLVSSSEIQNFIDPEKRAEKMGSLEEFIPEEIGFREIKPRRKGGKIPGPK